MPLSPFEKARRKVQQHLETFLWSSRPKPISSKSALYRAMNHWESFFPDGCFPLHEMSDWLDLIDQSKARDVQAFETARRLLEWVKGSDAIPYVPPKQTDPWYSVDLEARTVIILGRIFHIDSIPTLRIIEALLKGSAERPIPSRDLRRIPGCGHEKQIRRLLGNENVPQEIRRLIKAKGGAGGGRWMVPPLSDLSKTVRECPRLTSSKAPRRNLIIPFTEAAMPKQRSKIARAKARRTSYEEPLDSTSHH